MANEHGGYRRPANPASVSGPGAHSRRTDGKQPVMDLPDAAYGENATFREAQQGGPMPQGGGAMPGPQAPDMASILGGVTPMGADSAQPDVPVTDGADAGLGRGMGALSPDGMNYSQLDAKGLRQYVPTLIRLAESDRATPGFKQWVRAVLANL